MAQAHQHRLRPATRHDAHALETEQRSLGSMVAARADIDRRHQSRQRHAVSDERCRTLAPAVDQRKQLVSADPDRILVPMVQLA